MKMEIIFKQDNLNKHMVPSFGGYSVVTKGKTLPFDFEDMRGNFIEDSFVATQHTLDIDIFKDSWVENGFISKDDTKEVITEKIFKHIKESEEVSEAYVEIYDNSKDDYVLDAGVFEKLEISLNGEVVNLQSKRITKEAFPENVSVQKQEKQKVIEKPKVIISVVDGMLCDVWSNIPDIEVVYTNKYDDKHQQVLEEAKGLHCVF